ATGLSCTSSALNEALRGAGRAAAEALKAHDSSDAQLAELSDLNFTRLKHLGATEDEAVSEWLFLKVQEFMVVT
ncbi:hypothetical protein AK812_SmicGene46563, partial [Symbiodinium microadriaticum]